MGFPRRTVACGSSANTPRRTGTGTWNREISRELEAGTRQLDEGRLYRSVVEVVDIETGQLIASARVPGLVVTLLPDQHVVTYREDEAGVPFVDVFRMTLSGLAGGQRIPVGNRQTVITGTATARSRLMPM